MVAICSFLVVLKRFEEHRSRVVKLITSRNLDTVGIQSLLPDQDVVLNTRSIDILIIVLRLAERHLRLRGIHALGQVSSDATDAIWLHFATFLHLGE